MGHDEPVFEEKAKVLLGTLKGGALAARSDLAGGGWADGALSIPLFQRPHRITVNAITDPQGDPATPAVTVLLCRYLLAGPAPEAPIPTEWVTLRDIQGAGVLTSAVTQNTQKIIQTAFAGKLSLLKERAASLGGKAQPHPGYDLSIDFPALPRVPLLLHFNDADSEFPAQCVVLFERNAQNLLDLESLGIIVTYLAGNLIR